MFDFQSTHLRVYNEMMKKFHVHPPFNGRENFLEEPTVIYCRLRGKRNNRTLTEVGYINCDVWSIVRFYVSLWDCVKLFFQLPFMFYFA